MKQTVEENGRKQARRQRHKDHKKKKKERKNELVFLTGPTLDNEKTWEYFALFSITAREMPK